LAIWDALTLCAAHLFGRPAFVDTSVGPLPDLSVCPSTREGLVDALKESGNRLVESDESVFVTAEQWFNEPVPHLRYKWRQAVMRTKVGDLEPSEGMEPAEREEIVKAILRDTRTPPAGVRIDPDDAGGTTVTSIPLLLGAKTLRPGVKSILALWDNVRLAYGEIVDGRYQLKWDSPLLSGRNPGLAFPDIDGDGTPEIAVGSFRGRDRVLTIFNLRGDELTRQPEAECGTDVSIASHFGDKPQGVACPVFAEYVHVQPAPGGGKQILVEPTNGLPYRLVFRDGRFVREPDKVTK
jgi:hypothetical protein